MISLDEFKKSMGDNASKYTEEELVKLRDQMDGLADILFDVWLEKKNKSK